MAHGKDPARLAAHASEMAALLALIATADSPLTDAAGVSPWIRARLAETRALLARIDGTGNNPIAGEDDPRIATREDLDRPFDYDRDGVE